VVAAIQCEGDDRFRLARCAGCGVYTLVPMPTPGQLSRYYAEEYYGATRRKFVGPLADLVEWFQQGRARMVSARLAPDARVLDVGCGNGGFLLGMKARGFRAEGTEWTPESARRIPAEAGIPVHVGDLLEIDLAEGSFDAITLWHVFEHLAQPAETLEKIHRLLKPGGLLFLSMPNHESWQAERHGRHWFHLDPPRHLHGFGVRSLEGLLSSREFSVLHRHTWSLEQNPYGWLQSFLNASGFPRDRAYAALKGTAHNSGTRLLDLALVFLLAGPSVVLSVIESLAGRGGTMTFVARRRG